MRSMNASIRWRVPLVICGLLFVVITLYALASYGVVRRAVIADAGARLMGGVSELTTVLGNQIAQRQEAVREIARSPEVGAHLRAVSTGAEAGTAADVRDLLVEGSGSRTPVLTELRDAAGRVVAAVYDTMRVPPVTTSAELEQLGGARTGSATGRLRVLDGQPLYPITAAVTEEESELGRVVRWYSLSTSPESRALIQDLIGPDSRLYLGNASGDLWTDLSSVVADPIAVAPNAGVLEYRRPGAGSFLAANAVIPGTPWTVLVESPRDLVLAPARATLFWLILVGLAVLALGTGLAWALTSRMTGDLVELAAAAESIGRGEYGRRVAIDRADEIGALGRVFNTMSAAVAKGRSQLEVKIDQLAASEARHRETRDRLQHVTTSSPTVLYELRVTDGGSVLEWISDNIRERFGYSVEEAMEPGWRESHLHPEDRELLDAPAAADQGVEDRTREYRFQDARGEYRWLRDEARVLRGHDGGIIEIVGSLSDVSGRRQLEEQFRRSQKLEAVGRLAGGVAHDFNNLLTVILGEVDIVLETASDEEFVPAVTQPLMSIKGAATRAMELTRQLLTFSRQSVAEVTAFDPNAVVRELHSMLARVIGEDVRLELNLSERIGAVAADRGQVHQVLMNLVVNARDATPAGGTITMETAEVFLNEEMAGSHGRVTSGDFIVLSVTDTGTGMTEDVKAHLFEPFFTTKETGKGTGLGLATCYAIVDRFGGHIMVYSEVGVGTTVNVYLPRTEKAAGPASDPAIAGAPRGQETILVVEDDDAVRSITTRILRAQGYRILEAVDGQQALEVLEAHWESVDLLLTDAVMPRMGGRALAARARELYGDFPILFASGYSDEFVVQNQLFERGMALVQKPFTRDVLARKVREALDQGR